MTARSTGRPLQFKAALAYVVTHRPDESWRENPVFMRFYQGAKARANELGYRLEELAVHSPGMTARRYTEILRARGIHGLIVAPLPHGETDLGLDVSRFAVVGIGLSVITPTIERISSDHFQSMLLAIQKCHKLGYRRIGFVASQETSQRLGHRWLAAFAFGVQSLRVMKKTAPLLPPANEDIESALPKWCKAQQPDVIIFSVFNTHSPYQVPRGIGVVTLAVDDPTSDYSGIFQSDLLLGATALDHLVARLNRNQFGPDSLQHIHLVEGQWVAGHSAIGLFSTGRGKFL
jgi:LacI family transcriptional regulator